MTRLLLAIFFMLWMALAMSMNIPNQNDIFDIAAILFGLAACGVIISDLK